MNSCTALPSDLAQQVATALREDIGTGDATAQLVPLGQQARGRVITREDAVLCGAPWVAETYRQLDPSLALIWSACEGQAVTAGQQLFEVHGNARAVLSGERTALNFLQLLSATATAARQFVDAVAGSACTILDTRKTLPGLRTAQKYAVRCGGASNHRIGLFDQVLIKENHIAAAGSIGQAVAAARREASGLKVEVEVESLSELQQALSAGADIIMLDDFSLEDMRTAVRLTRQARSSACLEASGSMNLQTVRAVAATGVDYISVGSITKNVRAIDLSMRLEFSGHG